MPGGSTGYGTGDDLEIVETAAKYAAGLDYEPWNLRCLFHPLVLTWPFLRVGVLLGAADPAVLSWLGAIPTVLFSTLAIVLLYRLALAWRWPEETALAAAFLYAVHWLPLGYGSTLFPRPISTAFLLGAFLLASRRPPGAARAAAAGLLVAAAFAVRWSEGAALVPLVAWIWWRERDARPAGAVLAGFGLGALLFVGVTDTLTWGAPFSSLAAYAREMRTVPPNTRTDGPWYEYAKDILRWAGPLYLLLLWPARGDRRIRQPLLFLAAIVALLSCVRFKQMRYMQAAIPFLALAAAVGWERLRRSGAAGRRLAIAALLLAAAPRSRAHPGPSSRQVAVGHGRRAGDHAPLPRASRDRPRAGVGLRRPALDRQRTGDPRFPARASLESLGRREGRRRRGRAGRLYARHQPAPSRIDRADGISRERPLPPRREQGGHPLSSRGRPPVSARPESPDPARNARRPATAEPAAEARLHRLADPPIS